MYRTTTTRCLPGRFCASSLALLLSASLAGASVLDPAPVQEAVQESDPAPVQEAVQESEPAAAPDAAAGGAAEVLDETSVPEREPFHGHLPLGFNGAGLCLGNSRRWNGMRINIRDHGAELVRGVNITLWSPGKPSLERFDGLALGISPGAGVSNGLSLGLLASVSEESARGVQVGGLASVSGGSAHGVNIGGLAAVAGDELRGVNLGGLAVVSEGGMRGVNLGGLAVVAEGEVRGLNVGGLAVVSQEGVRGINAAGLSVVSEGPQRGIGLAGLAHVTGSDLQGAGVAGLAVVVGERLEGVGIAGLATVCGGDLRGVGLAGLTVGSGDFGWSDLDPTVAPDGDRDTSAHGLMLAGYRVQANELRGVAGALLVLRAHEMTGFSFGAYHGVSGKQTGASVGLFNYASDLQGIQIGILNHVASNPPWARWLPLVNARF